MIIIVLEFREGLCEILMNVERHISLVPRRKTCLEDGSERTTSITEYPGICKTGLWAIYLTRLYSQECQLQSCVHRDSINGEETKF